MSRLRRSGSFGISGGVLSLCPLRPAKLLSVAAAPLCEVIIHEDQDAEKEGDSEEQGDEQQDVQVDRSMSTCVHQSENKGPYSVHCFRACPVFGFIEVCGCGCRTC